MNSNTVVCQECGFKYDGQQKLCPMCGSKKRSRAENNDSGSWASQPKRGKKDLAMLGRFLIIAAVVAVLFVTVKVGKLVRNPNLKPEPDSGWMNTDTVCSAEEVPALPASPEEMTESELAALSEEEIHQRCQEIVDAYTAKIETITPQLMEEFEADVEGQTDSQYLAMTCNEKMVVLSELCNEGLSTLWDLLYQTGVWCSGADSEQYSVYEEELNGVYEDEAMKISDLYSDYCMKYAE